MIRRPTRVVKSSIELPPPIIILFGLTTFQLLLALGLPLGRAAWGGYYVTLPVALRVGSLVSAAVYLTMLFYVLARSKT